MTRVGSANLWLAAVATGAAGASAFAAGGGMQSAAQPPASTVRAAIAAEEAGGSAERWAERQYQQELGFVARLTAANARAVPAERLSVVSSTIGRYPLSGMRSFSFKVLDPVAQEIHSVVLDESGNELDEDILAAAEKAAHLARFGKLDPRLHDALATQPADQAVPVIVWLRDREFAAPPRTAASPTEAAPRAAVALAPINQARDEVVSQIVTPVLDQFALLGLSAETDAFAPVVYAQLTPDQIETVALLPEVDTIYLSEPMSADLASARAAIGMAGIPAGTTGTGTRVAVIEVNALAAANNPFLAGTTQDPNFTVVMPADPNRRDPNCDFVDDHATHVAGIIRSTHATQRGIAPNCTLWLGGGRCAGFATNGNQQLQSAMTAAADWGAWVFNCSFGANGLRVPDSSDRFCDDLVRNRWRTVVVSAGNRGLATCNTRNDGSGNVGSPGTAYNVITVGDWDERGTATLTDDRMSVCSSWRDPTSTNGDREKPELAAPGTNIISASVVTGLPADPNRWVSTSKSGTSMAAPMVSGAAALLMQRAWTVYQSTLNEWPETIKAILMASAVNNIRDPNGAVSGTRLSEYDGVGGINVDAAIDVLDFINGGHGGVEENCLTTRELGRMTLAAGRRTRVVLCWNTNSTYTSYASKPSVDLDLLVVGAVGLPPFTGWTSTSKDNTYEIVEFTPPIAGVYPIVRTAPRCDNANKSPYVGWAWYQLP